ncbi:MAG TPA: pitrilysin family protein [Alphaproteobacteria bacterium]|nr:pitrilysin family protein [Alphaproteobacteria bacterium]
MTVEVTTLANGLRVASDTMEDAESTVIGAWVGVGTRHEPWNANGVAHLTEHMMFKGTKTRSAYALSAAIEKRGGSMNAHTTREETAYYARVLPEQAGHAMEIIADMLQYSLFKPRELERERHVIIQEIGRDFDTPEEHAFDLMHRLAFPRQRLGRPILGEAKIIAKMPHAAVTDYVRRHYHAGNMVIIGAGRIAHEERVDLARTYFGRLPRGKPAKAEKARATGGELRIKRDIEQLHIVLGFPGPGFHGAAIYPVQLLGILLGGTASSRLFQKVREKRGLVYHISAGHIPFHDTGIFEIYAGTDPARAGELMPVVWAELKDVKRRVTPAELACAKAQARADLLMGRESVMRRADILGHQILAFGHPIPAERILRKLEAVTAQDVAQAATRLFARRPIFVTLGPGEKGRITKK